MGYTGYSRGQSNTLGRMAYRRARAAKALYDKALASKYKPNNKSLEIIGLPSAVFTHITTDSVPGTLTQTTFDTTSRSDSAQILLTNSTGSSKTIISAWIRGKPVMRLSDGKQLYSSGGGKGSPAGSRGGFLHDKYIDYESIAKNGDVTFETGNNFCITADQVNRLADYYWKLNRTKKHIYTLSLVGFQSWYEPGEWYTLQIGGVGEEEYIDSTVECFDVRCSLAAGGAPYTSVSFREVEENWKFDSNEVARQIAAGDFSRSTNNNVVTVAAQYYGGYADYYCDGTADQTEINAAIAYLGEVGGGTVHLSKGNYNTTSAITLVDGIRLEGEGKASLIVKNCNDYAIAAIGDSTTSITDISLVALGVTRSPSDTNVKPLIYFEYVDESAIDGILVDDSAGDGIDIVYCDTVTIGGGVKINGCAGTGLKTVQSIVIIASAISIAACGSGYECWPSIGTDKIDRGNCEDTTTPAMAGETSITSSDATWARSDVVSYQGTYSYKYTDTAGLGFVAELAIADNKNTDDLHGATAGKSYCFTCMLYIPSGQGDASELEFNLRQYYGGAWHYTYLSAKKPLPIYDAWQRMSMIITLDASATGFFTIIQSGFVANEYCYLDNICLYEFDETDSGAQLVNSSIDSCATGVIVANSHAIIQNNQITGCTNSGLVIAAGYRNLVTGNRAYNNGDDTGLSNENGDNFYDGGIDTQWAG